MSTILDLDDDGTPTAAAPVRVLIIDDNPDDADTLAVLLSFRGYDVRVAYSATEAVAEAERFRPQALLVDILLPEVDGYELAGNLKARLPEALLIATTGLLGPAYQERGKAAGFEHHLLKPVSVAKLRQILGPMDPNGRSLAVKQPSG